MTLERDIAQENPVPAVSAAIAAGEDVFKQAIADNGCELVGTARIVALLWDPEIIWVTTGPMAIPAEHQLQFAARLRDFADLLERANKADEVQR